MLNSNVCLNRTYHGCTLQLSVILVLAVSLDVTNRSFLQSPPYNAGGEDSNKQLGDDAAESVLTAWTSTKMA